MATKKQRFAVDGPDDGGYPVIIHGTGCSRPHREVLGMLEVTEAARAKLSEFIEKQKLTGAFRVYQSYG